MLKFALLLAVASQPAIAGPISKFDAKQPYGVFQTPRPLEEVERCLMDMDGWTVPTVYRQPDRPDRATLLWSPNGTTGARIDLQRTATGTRVTSWLKAEQVRQCSPS